MKLDICTRTRRNPGFLNVDGHPGASVDFVADIRRTLPFGDATVEEIFSCATIEHIMRVQVPKVLGEFYRILIPGSVLSIAVPDLDRIVKGYLNKTFHYEIINQYIYGQLIEGSPIEYDCHKSIWNLAQLSEALTKAGFKDIEEVKYNEPVHIKELMIKVTCKK
jgi:predicted SAM-dependent methyltransferase